MKYYPIKLKENYILSYELNSNNINIKLANKKYIQIPYTKENETAILAIMEDQKKEFINMKNAKSNKIMNLCYGGIGILGFAFSYYATYRYLKGEYALYPSIIMGGVCHGIFSHQAVKHTFQDSCEYFMNNKENIQEAYNNDKFSKVKLSKKKEYILTYPQKRA